MKHYCDIHLPRNVSTTLPRCPGSCATCGVYGNHRYLMNNEAAIRDDESLRDDSPVDIVEAAIVAETVIEALTESTPDTADDFSALIGPERYAR